MGKRGRWGGRVGLVVCHALFGCGSEGQPTFEDGGQLDEVSRDSSSGIDGSGTAETDAGPVGRDVVDGGRAPQDVPTATCGDRVCGSDGVGGSCGVCAAGLSCVLGHCLCDPPCPQGFTCGSTGTCDLDPTALWVLTVTTGTVAAQGAGGAWDPLGGAPDPQVCIALSGRTTCTPYASDTFLPTWNFDFPATAAGILQAGVATSYVDYDPGSANDPICPAYTLAINRATFQAGGTTVHCSTGGWSFTLRAQ